MSKQIIILEQTSSIAEKPEHIDIPRGYSVADSRVEECDHPKTRYHVDKETGEVVELCQVCGEESREEINTDLERQE